MIKIAEIVVNGNEGERRDNLFEKASCKNKQ